MSITTVISYCTNDYRFLGKCIEEASHFSQQIIVPVCDHFFNGMPENRPLLEATYAQFPHVQFIEFPYGTLYPSYIRLSSQDREWSAHWHSLARLLGFYHASSEWILFLDTDEIVEGIKWRESFDSFTPYNAIRLACYFYVLKASIRATKVQDLTLLVRKSSLHPSFFYQPDERYGMFKRVQGSKKTEFRGLDQRPLIHHYSWVRPENEILQKVTTWGHRLDKNWQEVVRGLFGSAGQKVIFEEPMEFEEVSPYFDPLNVVLPKESLKGDRSNVKQLKVSDFLRLELEHLKLM